MEQRYDQAYPVTFETTPQGFMRVSGRFTRVGVLVYEYRDEKTGEVRRRRELRHPDEVFNADSLKTLVDAPITDLHPVEFVNLDNARDVSRGHVSSAQPTGRFVSGDGIIDSPELVSKMQEGARCECSPGYRTRLDFTPGEWDGEKYDAIQRDIVYNHLAIGPVGWGRSGSDVRLDGAVASEDGVGLDAIGRVGVEIESADTESSVVSDDGDTMDTKTIKVSGIECRVDAAHAQVIEKTVSELSQKCDSLTGELEKIRADHAIAAKRADDAETKHKEYVEQESARVDAAIALRIDALRVLTEDETGGASGRKLQELVVAKSFKMDAKELEDKHDEYIAGLFQHAVSTAKTENKALDDAVKNTTETKTDSSDIDPEVAFNKAAREAYKRTAA